nr:hypothetical protein [Pandoravirus belohorizontensis]
MSGFIQVFSWIYSGTSQKLGVDLGYVGARVARPAGLLSLRNFGGPPRNNSVLLSAALAVGLSLLSSLFFPALQYGAPLASGVLLFLSSFLSYFSFAAQMTTERRCQK